MSKATILVLILALVITGVALAADSITLQGYIIDVVGHTENGSQSTWTYAVTSTGNIPGQGGGLSHITFELLTCSDFLVAPLPGPYTTPTNITACTDGTYTLCQESNYKVVYGPDPTTGLTGIKFEDPSPILDQENLATHIYQITVDNYVGEADNLLGIKTGSGVTVGLLNGPLCEEPLAISMSSFDVDTGQVGMGALGLSLALILLTGAVLVAKHNAKN